DGHPRPAARHGNLEHFAHAFDAAGLLVVEALDLRAENRRVRDDRHFHFGQVEVEAELQRAVALGPAVEPPDSLPHQTKLRRALQSHAAWHRLSRGLAYKFRILGRLTVGAVNDALFCSALLWRHTPALCGGRNEHRPRLGAKLTVLLKRVCDRA